MNSRTTFLKDSEYAALASLGIAFNVTADFSAPPEKIISKILDKDRFIGNRVYSLLLLFFQEFHEFIRIDLLSKESSKIHPIGKATISALCLYCKKKLNDKRFEKYNYFYLPVLEDEVILKSHERRELEPELLEVGIINRKLGKQPLKKLMTRQWLVRNNIWIRNRLLLGVSVRADSFSILELQPVSTYYALSKLVSSSITAARKNFHDYHLLQKSTA